MQVIGGLLGGLIVWGYVLTSLNFFVKVINKRFGKMMTKKPLLKKRYSNFMRIIVRYHKLFGFLTITFVLMHFYIQFTLFGVNTTGAIAAGIMMLQVLLGIYGALIYKKRSGIWFYAHRGIAVILLVAIVMHIL